jgi:Zn-dependent peptidase ImmA (M78 family)/transcriptional regulator with XRE-family HTH domain
MAGLAVSGFVKERLTQARNARGLTAVSLADLVDVSRSTMSLYEKGTQKPRQEIVDRLAKALNVPPTFFLREVPIVKPNRLFYRSMSAATKSARTRAEARYEWALELVDYLLGFFDFPELRLPEFELPPDFRQLDTLTIESIAGQVRQYWVLGHGPIDNVVRTLESNGIIVWRTPFEANTLDAFSEYRDHHPVVVLSSDKENYFRSRFDAAHELGHLVLHRNVDKRALNKSQDFKLLETQAHRFAGAFLLPEISYSKELWDVSLDAFRSLKPRWNVSIALQIKRCAQLGLINEDQEKRLWINLSRRKWRECEPLDESTLSEKPDLIAKSIRMLVKERVRTGEQLARDLDRYPVEIEKLCEIESGLLTGSTTAMPVFKTADSKVVPFRR